MTTEQTHRVAKEQIRQYVERLEQLDQEASDIAEHKKAVLDEAGSAGYDKKVLRKLIALRKRDANDVAEEEVLMAMYSDALGMGNG